MVSAAGRGPTDPYAHAGAAYEALALALPRSFAWRWRRSLRLRRPVLPLISTPARFWRCFGSNFFIAAMLSSTRAKPELLPPPKAVFMPKTCTQFASFTLYVCASFSDRDFLLTLPEFGCTTSITNCLRPSIGLLMNFFTRTVNFPSDIARNRNGRALEPK